MSDAYVGVDVGGTKVAVATLRDRRFTPTVVEPTELDSAPELIEQLATVVAAELASGWAAKTRS